ncbi:MAG: hypothetical protein GQ559_04240 [Desulfobulbaceae bacterium]|nr:hypothetical protein [Desulfobulbaceae bacterium]
MTSDSDRRKNVRVPLDARVECQVRTGGIEYSGAIRDLSMGGFFMQASVPAVTDAPCVSLVTFRGEHSDLEIDDLQGSIIRVEEDGVAVRFTHYLEWFSLVPMYARKIRE